MGNLQEKYARQCIPGDVVAFNHYMRTFINHAKRLKYEFSLTTEQFREIAEQPCFYCGEPPKPWFPKRRKQTLDVPYICNGLDRVNSEKGYIKENCVPCCTPCNLMKRQTTLPEFLAKIKAIAIYRRLLSK